MGYPLACPLSDARIVIVGGGKMGEALLRGWIASSADPAECLESENFLIVNPTAERRDCLSERYGVACVADVRDVDRADLVVLAVKPQVMREVLTAARSNPAFFEQPALFVSIAAGLTTDALLGMLLDETDDGYDGASQEVSSKSAQSVSSSEVHLVRTMPNMPLMVGAGATAVCASRTSNDDDVALVRDLFACLGDAWIVDEADMDAVCAVSGSGPAYVAWMIEALRDAGVACGLDASLSGALAQQTVYGTSLLMKQTGQSPETTRESICSPGGTTARALEAMDDAGFTEVFDRGVRAAYERSRELSEC